MHWCNFVQKFIFNRNDLIKNNCIWSQQTIWSSLPCDLAEGALKLHCQLDLLHALLTLELSVQLVMLCHLLRKWRTLASEAVLSVQSWHQSIWEVVCGGWVLKPRAISLVFLLVLTFWSPCREFDEQRSRKDQANLRLDCSLRPAAKDESE